MTKRYNKENPPLWGELTVNEWKAFVDETSFPECEWCNQKIYNPAWYDEEACGPCMTGESKELLEHSSLCDCPDCAELDRSTDDMDDDSLDDPEDNSKVGITAEKEFEHGV